MGNVLFNAWPVSLFLLAGLHCVVWTEVLHLIRYFWVDTISQQAIDVLTCLLLHVVMMLVCMWWHVNPLSFREDETEAR